MVVSPARARRRAGKTFRSSLALASRRTTGGVAFKLWRESRRLGGQSKPDEFNPLSFAYQPFDQMPQENFVTEGIGESRSVSTDASQSFAAAFRRRWRHCWFHRATGSISCGGFSRGRRRAGGGGPRHAGRGGDPRWAPRPGGGDGGAGRFPVRQQPYRFCLVFSEKGHAEDAWGLAVYEWRRALGLCKWLSGANSVQRELKLALQADLQGLQQASPQHAAVARAGRREFMSVRLATALAANAPLLGLKLYEAAGPKRPSGLAAPVLRFGLWACRHLADGGTRDPTFVAKGKDMLTASLLPKFFWEGADRAGAVAEGDLFRQRRSADAPASDRQDVRFDARHRAA